MGAIHLPRKEWVGKGEGGRGNRQSATELFSAENTETVFKEKHGVWDLMPKLTATSPYVDSNT
jgi:hypothetical protein